MNVNDMNLEEITKTLSLLKTKRNSPDGLTDEEESLVKNLEKRRRQYVSEFMDDDLKTVYCDNNYLY